MPETNTAGPQATGLGVAVDVGELVELATGAGVKAEPHADARTAMTARPANLAMQWKFLRRTRSHKCCVHLHPKDVQHGSGGLFWPRLRPSACKASLVGIEGSELVELIDRVLALDYLEPELREKVLRLRGGVVGALSRVDDSNGSAVQGRGETVERIRVVALMKTPTVPDEIPDDDPQPVL